MDKLYGVLGSYTPSYLLADPESGKRIAISVEPGHGVLKQGTLLYRKTGTVMYAPAAAANVVATNFLAVLGQDVDTTESETVAPAAMAYTHGTFITGRVVLDADAEITEAMEPVLRAQGIEFNPMVNYAETPATPEADNEVSGG